MDKQSDKVKRHSRENENNIDVEIPPVHDLPNPPVDTPTREEGDLNINSQTDSTM